MNTIELLPLEVAKKEDAAPVTSKVHNRPRFTGKRLVVMAPGVTPSASIKKFSTKGSLKLASAADFKTNPDKLHEALNQGDGVYFNSFNIAVVNKANEEQIRFMEDAGTTKSGIISNEPERYVYALPSLKIIQVKKPKAAAPNPNYTWGVEAIKLLTSNYTGKGINVAVLDTGLNLAHPDFKGIKVTHKSFIQGQQVEDGNGHGTHCSGISVGAYDKASDLRYGVAREANLFIGKVLSNQGSGDDAGIIAGIEWALQNKCKVISMSLGSEVGVGETFSPAYERIGKTAIRNNCLIVAAAGNESERQFGVVKPVGHPANCPSILSVAALDNNFNVATFSCGGLNPDGGQIDIAAPGVNILSSWKGKTYKAISGTSMATPFVAGVAALYWQAYPDSKASDIWMLLVQNAKRLNLNSSDVGSGIVQVK